MVLEDTPFHGQNEQMKEGMSRVAHSPSIVISCYSGASRKRRFTVGLRGYPNRCEATG